MDKIDEVLSRGVVEILPNSKGLAKLMRQRKIRLYLGIDPTGFDLHLGHTIPLRKLKQFQDLGHEVILLVGTFTAQVGDPSERDEKRKPLTPAQIKKNMATYQKQAAKILDFSKVKIKYNADWLAKLTFKDLAKLTSHFTVPQLLERDMFQRRMKKNKEVWVNEFLYPLMQGYDSVAMNVDLEVGGTDQTFNMLVGRRLQKIYNQKEKFVLTTPMLAGLDSREMSKTYHNTVNITDPPHDMYGKIMSLQDELIIQYFEMSTDVPLQTIKEHKRTLKSNPMGLKKQLAFEIVKLYHSEKAAEEAQKEFERVFQKKKSPLHHISIYDIKKARAGKANVIEILTKSGLVPSRSEAKRLVTQGAVDVDGKTLADSQSPFRVKDGTIIRVGKRKFLKIRIK